MRTILALCALSFSCLAAQTASASPIHFEGMGKDAVVRINSPRFGPLWVYAGELDWSWEGTPAGYSTWFYSYCVDATDYEFDHQSVTVDSTDALTTYYTAPATDAGKKAAWLFNAHASEIHNAANTGLTNAKAAALQVAIWEVLYDGPLYSGSGALDPGAMLGAGNFKLLSASTDVTAWTQTYLSELFYGTGPNGAYHTSSATWLNAYPHDNGSSGQDQMTASPTPEPATMLMFASGLVLIWRLRRGRNSARKSNRIWARQSAPQ